MTQALTPGQFNAITNILSVAAIMLGVPLIVCGAGELWRKWREAGERVDRLADPAPLPGEIGDDTLRMLREPTAEDAERAISALLRDLERGEGNQ